MATQFTRHQFFAMAFSLCAIAMVGSTALGEVRLAKVFCDHMVLQRDRGIPIWGWADPDEEIVVTLGGRTKKTRAEIDGEWGVKFEKFESSDDPLTMTVRGKNTVTVNDVLIGEVWICSGQSNMAMTVNRARDFEVERQTADFPRIRMFTVRSGAAAKPQEDCEGQWEVCSSETVGTFSATAYFFGRELHRQLDVPIGLINSSVGGTAIEAWTSLDVQKEHPELKPVFDEWDRRAMSFDHEAANAHHEKQMQSWRAAVAEAKAKNRKIPRRPQEPIDPRLDRNHPSNLFNGKIAPVIPYGIRGAIWYQGEHNARSFETATRYRTQLPLLIKDWRTRWSQGDFPFAWVQLPNYKKQTENPQSFSEWATMRESMSRCLETSNTGMAVTIDIGEANDIHPKNKQDVGRRLGNWALSKVYGREVSSAGPVYLSHKVEDSRVVIQFKNSEKGLMTPSEEVVQGFAIAGEDKRWYWASAAIHGSSVIVSHPMIMKPAAVRYAWGDNPPCNLFSKSGLPAAPFRTDDWPISPEVSQ